VLVLGAGLICLRLVRAGGDLGPADPVLAVPIGLLAISYCRTNLVAAARLAVEFHAKPPDSVRPPMVAAAVAPVAAALLAAGLFGWPIGYFLFGPASMTLCIFCWLAGRVAANPQASRGARSAGLVATCGLLALSPALGPAILFPVLVGAAVFGWLAARNASGRLARHGTTRP
jgi:hypothetical protein